MASLYGLIIEKNMLVTLIRQFDNKMLTQQKYMRFKLKKIQLRLI